MAEISTLGGATNLVNAPAWLGNVTWDLLAGTNQIRNLHATGPLSIALANDDWTLSFGCDAYTTQQTDDAIAAALTIRVYPDRLSFELTRVGGRGSLRGWSFPAREKKERIIMPSLEFDLFLLKMDLLLKILGQAQG